jgi:chaperonin GroES
MSKKIGLKPMGDRVVVKPMTEHERGQKTKSGIYIPETAEKERSERGTIMAVGPGKTSEEGKTLPMHVKVGDVVLFTKYGPDEVKLDGEEYFILSESNILAVLE